ncbi:hypothetical protein STEG23_005658 [Scotinomys teguina]
MVLRCLEPELWSGKMDFICETKRGYWRGLECTTFAKCFAQAVKILVKLELAHGGMQALHLQHRSPSSYRVKARASYVDETLFGSPTGTRPAPPDFDPPWVQNCNGSRGVGPGTPKDSLVKRNSSPRAPDPFF